MQWIAIYAAEAITIIKDQCTLVMLVTILAYLNDLIIPVCFNVGYSGGINNIIGYQPLSCDIAIYCYILSGFVFQAVKVQ